MNRDSEHISGNGVDRQLVDLSSSGQTLMTASAIAIWMIT